MFGDKKLLGLMLIALIFIVSCSAKPVEIISDDLEKIKYNINGTRRESRAMGCSTNANYPHITICRDLDVGKVNLSLWGYLNNILENHLPDKGTFTYYSTCYSMYGTCVAMSTLTGSQFTPINYQHIARLALDRLKNSSACSKYGYTYYAQSTDIYMYEHNFYSVGGFKILSFKWFRETVIITILFVS